MNFRHIAFAFVCASFAAFTAPGVAADSIAQRPKTLTAAEIAAIKERVTLATGLIALGRKDKDAQLLATGAKLLTTIDANVIDPASMAAGGEPKAFDVGAILAEARALSGGEEAAKNVMAKIDLSNPKPQSICNWVWECNSVECDRYYICTSD